MSVTRILLYGLLAWFLYKLVFGFIIPVYRTTRQMKKKFREMQERMQEEQLKQQGFGPQPTQAGSTSSKVPSGDYIDFEEIK
ncbi:MAG: hypothetical protein JNN00_08410 [Chitinophagaceae bacterium]|nr:hypothetical protein [Chitinophagaceae bacterium]